MHNALDIWRNIPTHLLQLGIAFVLALPVGWDQEKASGSAGLCTFSLVAVASCGLVLLGIEVLGEDVQSQARIIAGMIAGVGFIGGGAILNQGGSVHGTATAASIWTVGIIGTAVGYGYYDIGLVLAASNFLSLRVLRPLKRRFEADAE